MSVGSRCSGIESDGGAEAVLAAADEAMYRAKADGRDRGRAVRVPGRRARRRLPSDRTTSAKIRNAITQNRLQPCDAADHQPRRRRRSSASSCCCGCGARPASCSPAAAFVGVAERSGMIQELDRWVVGQALDLLGAHQRAGDPMSLHMNLSGASLTDISVLEFIERRLDEGDGDPGRCTFEITQTARVEDLEMAGELRRPADRVRLRSRDRRLRRRLRPLRVPEALPLRRDQDRRRLRPRHGPQRRRPAHRTGDRRHRRGLGEATIAEFVEDEETATMLRAYGVDMAQGSASARPSGSRKACWRRPDAQLRRGAGPVLTLPEVVFGSWSTNSTIRGAL